MNAAAPFIRFGSFFLETNTHGQPVQGVWRFGHAQAVVIGFIIFFNPCVLLLVPLPKFLKCPIFCDYYGYIYVFWGTNLRNLG